MSYTDAGSMAAVTTASFAPPNSTAGTLATVAPPAPAGPIDLSNVSVTIESGLGISGIYPFIAVCLDDDTKNELFKTGAKNNGQSTPVKFNESFEFNLAMYDRSRLSQGRPLPRYLTFFLYDVGDDTIPSVGSAGVLLDTVRQNGTSSGDFQVINGTGKLSLFVTAQHHQMAGLGQGQMQLYQHPGNTQNNMLNKVQQDQSNSGKSWYKTDGAKIAAGVVGVGALAAGVAAVAVGSKKKKNRKKELEKQQQQQHALSHEEEDEHEFDDEDLLHPTSSHHDDPIHGPSSSSGHH